MFVLAAGEKACWLSVCWLSIVIMDVGGEVGAKYPPSSSSLLQPVVSTREPNNIELIMNAFLEEKNVSIIVGLG